MSPLNSQPARLLLGRSSRCPLAPRRRSSRQFWNTALICLGLQLIFVLPAAGQRQTDELARRHFESGASYLEQSDYESALREFKKSYELSERPEILLNLALVHERTGDWEHAISAINKFIAAAPESERIGTLKLRRDNLQKRLDEQRAALTALARLRAHLVAPALERDETLFLASAWNDNGFSAFGHPGALRRSLWFPGLGWLLPRRLWEVLASEFGIHRRRDVDRPG